MTIAYLENTAGMNNDMLLGAWFDLGVSQEEWRKYMEKLGVHEQYVVFKEVKVKGTAAIAVKINNFPLSGFTFLANIEKTIDSWELPKIVKEKSKQVFQHWAKAEAKVRNIDSSEIRLEQIVSMETVGSIVGNILAWHLLDEPQCYISTILIGKGWNKREAEWNPIPEAAAIELLLGYPTLSLWDSRKVISTETAALISILTTPAPHTAFIGERVGYGAEMEHTVSGELLRVQLGQWDHPTQSAPPSNPKKGDVVIEANIDDMSPELAGNLIKLLLSKGAMDAYMIPIIMKKGRPGIQLRVACKIERQMEIQKEIVRQTTTIGMRHYSVKGWAVPHKIIPIQTSFGEIPVKFAYLDGEIVNIAPEFEACFQVAESLGMSVKSVYQTVLSEAIRKFPYSTN